MACNFWSRGLYTLSIPANKGVRRCLYPWSNPSKKPIWAQMFLHVVKHSIYSNPTKRRYQRRNKGCAWDTDLIAPVRRSWFIGHDRDSASTITDIWSLPLFFVPQNVPFLSYPKKNRRCRVHLGVKKGKTKNDLGIGTRYWCYNENS